MSNNRNIKAVDVKCPNKDCSQDLRHGGFEVYGTNIRGDITSKLLKEFQIEGTEHIFYRKRDLDTIKDLLSKFKLSVINKDRSKYLQVPDPIEGHHLITCEAVKGDDWYKLFYVYCYDINCPQNGVLLPGDMLVACHFEVPLHMGNHEATAILQGDAKEYSAQKSYVDYVKHEVDDVLTDREPSECRKITAQEIRDFHTEMLEISSIIFDKVKDFKWLISSDGMHYHPGSTIGCYDDCRTLTQKRRLMAEKTSVTKGSNKTAQWVVNIAKKFEESGYTGCKTHNHKEHGCPSSKSFSWDKARWDKKDEIIEKLEDDK